MRSILVIGSIEDKEKLELFKKLCSKIGKIIVEMGHILINGGTDNPLHVDKYVAEGAKITCEEKGYNIKSRILSIVREEDKPHGLGTMLMVRGEVESEKRLNLIQKADAIIVIGGSKGTKEYVVLGETTKKPIIPIPQFRGVGQEYFNKYINYIPKYFPESIMSYDFEYLNQILSSDEIFNDIAEYSINLAKKSFSESNYIFIAMPFKSGYNNTLRAIKQAVEKANEDINDVQYVCERMDEIKETVRIDAEIESKIKHAKLIIADVSEENSNVYYELGFARGQGINVIPIATKDANLKFDTKMLRTEFYDLTSSDINTLERNIDNFANTLKECIKVVHNQSLERTGKGRA